MEIERKVKENEKLGGVSTHPHPRDISGCISRDSGRIEFVDTAKGVCILLVVLFHCGIISESIPLLGMLRMPFYFTLSGMFFKDYGGFFKTLLKKINKLFIPFLFFFTMSYVIFVVIKLVIGGEIDIPYHCFVTSKTMINIALWFLLALFSANILFYAILKICRNIYIVGIACIATAIIALNIFSKDFFLPMYVDSAMVALPFLYFGYCLRKSKLLERKRDNKKENLSILILVIVAFLAYTIGGKPYIGIGTLFTTGSKFCFYIVAFGIVLAMLLICKIIGSIPGIKYIGRYSIIILGMHITIHSLSIYANDYLGILPEGALLDVILFMVTLAGSILCIPLLRKYAPKLTAQEDLIPNFR